MDEENLALFKAEVNGAIQWLAAGDEYAAAQYMSAANERFALCLVEGADTDDDGEAMVTEMIRSSLPN